MPDGTTAENSYTASILFQQYLLDHLGNYTDPSTCGLAYQMEYIYGGRDNDMDNLKSVAAKLSDGRYRETCAGRGTCNSYSSRLSGSSGSSGDRNGTYSVLGFRIECPGCKGTVRRGQDSAGKNFRSVADFSGEFIRTDVGSGYIQEK